MTDHAKFIIRTRGIIIYDDKLLVVKNDSNDFYCLPGGKIEIGETIQHSLKREITEELGVEPSIGRLLFTNSFIEKNGNQSIEFIFEVTNGVEYLGEKRLKGTHSFELNDICWIGKNENKTILPKSIQDFLNGGALLSDTVRFLSDK